MLMTTAGQSASGGQMLVIHTPEARGRQAEAMVSNADDNRWAVRI
jgi:hypothetical protein